MYGVLNQKRADHTIPIFATGVVRCPQGRVQSIQVPALEGTITVGKVFFLRARGAFFKSPV